MLYFRGLNVQLFRLLSVKCFLAGKLNFFDKLSEINIFNRAKNLFSGHRVCQLLFLIYFLLGNYFCGDVWIMNIGIVSKLLIYGVLHPSFLYSTFYKVIWGWINRMDRRQGGICLVMRRHFSGKLLEFSNSTFLCSLL